MFKKIFLSSLTRCFIISLIYTILIISIYNNKFKIMITIIILYTSPFFFIIYGIIRQIIYEKRSHFFICTFVLIGTIIIYGLYYIIDEAVNFGINKIYWFGFIGSPAYILYHAGIPALCFFIGSLFVKAIQYTDYKISIMLKTDSV